EVSKFILFLFQECKYFCYSKWRHCIIKDTRDLPCIFFILRGFVRYTRKPKDNKKFILAESGYGYARQNGQNNNWQGSEGGEFLSDLLKKYYLSLADF